MSYTNNLITPISAADFTSVGTGLTAVNTAYGINLTKSNTSGHNLSGIYKAGTSPSTITTCISLNGLNPDTGVALMGPGWSDGTKYVVFYLMLNGTAGQMSIGIGKYNTTTSFSADYQQNVDTYMSANQIWMRILDNGSNRQCALSKDGITFTIIHSVGRTDFLTATRVGMFVNPFSADTNVTLLSWIGA